MAWSTRLWLYHPPSEPLAVKFFPDSVPRGPVLCSFLALDGCELTRDEGTRTLARLAQPLLRGHAVLVVAENILQRGRGLRGAAGNFSGDGRGGLCRVPHPLGKDPNAMQLWIGRLVGECRDALSQLLPVASRQAGDDELGALVRMGGQGRRTRGLDQPLDQVEI